MQRGAGFFPAPAASHFVSRSFKEQEWGPGFPKEVLLGRILETKNRLSEFQITGLNRDLSGNRTRVYAVRGRRLDRLTNRPYLILFNRGDVIRTRDLCVPNAALYQTEPRLDMIFSLLKRCSSATPIYYHAFKKNASVFLKKIEKVLKN